VNLCQRLQQFAANGQIVVSEPTWSALTRRPDGAEQLPPETVKGRDTPVRPYRIGAGAWGSE
jgi:class 3 adenylate cyclase